MQNRCLLFVQSGTQPLFVRAFARPPRLTHTFVHSFGGQLGADSGQDIFFAQRLRP